MELTVYISLLTLELSEHNLVCQLNLCRISSNVAYEETNLKLCRDVMHFIIGDLHFMTLELPQTNKLIKEKIAPSSL